LDDRPHYGVYSRTLTQASGQEQPIPLVAATTADQILPWSFHGRSPTRHQPEAIADYLRNAIALIDGLPAYFIFNADEMGHQE
jgi:hypothetical protein